MAGIVRGLMSVLYEHSHSTMGMKIFDAICHHNASVNCIQAVTPAAYVTLGALLPLDARGAFVWVNAPDPDVADAEVDRVLTLVEDAGLSLHFL